MAVREYIGARYVPIFGRKGEESIAWDNTGAYEPLTVVLYQGNSYTSRQYVPAGIEITNENYWALTGNYNAQIEAYRAEVQTFDNRITANADAILENSGDIAAEVADRISADDAITSAYQAADAAETTARESAINAINTRLENFTVTVEEYGAIGDGVTDCTTAIQAAIDDNPNACIGFKGGVYCISSTIFLNGDVDSVSLNLNGSTILWTGETDTWTETQSYTVIPESEGITSSPNVMIGIMRRSTTGKAGRTYIVNGTIDADMKASICCQNLAFLTVFHNLRIQNFQYAGIMNGTLNGYLWESGQTTSSSRSTQTAISDCYFVRGGDMSARNTSAMWFSFPDNQIDNCITNRTMYGFTMRNGGNSVSNTHTTIQYKTMPSAANYGGAAVRLWPFNAGTVQINIFDNCYFNGGKRAFYTYRDSTQQFTGAAFRTIVSNSHYTFYTSGTSFTSTLEAEWYGGLWYGIITTDQCVLLYGDYINMHLYAPPASPSLFVARANEKTFAPFGQPREHSTMHDGNNYVTGETFPINNSAAPLPGAHWKKVAELVYTAPVGTYHFPGALKFEHSAQNGAYFFAGEIVRSGSTYAVNTSESFGSQTSIKLYVRDANVSFTYNGLVHYVTEIYAYAGANVTDIRYLKLEPTSPYVDVYGFADPHNFTSGSNQNIYDEEPSNLIQFV